jgi:hypothetical protein
MLKTALNIFSLCCCGPSWIVAEELEIRIDIRGFALYWNISRPT